MKIDAEMLLAGMQYMKTTTRALLETTFGLPLPDDIENRLKGYDDMYDDAYSLWKDSLEVAEVVEQQ